MILAVTTVKRKLIGPDVSGPINSLVIQSETQLNRGKNKKNKPSIQTLVRPYIKNDIAVLIIIRRR